MASAATLFGDFSFASHVHNDKENTRGLDASCFSPKSHRSSFFPSAARETTPSPPCAVRDLADALDQQNLRIHVADIEPPSSPSTISDAPSPTSTSTSRLNSATRRMQRQANARMLSSTSHVRDIAELVQKMIDTDDQCTICDRNLTIPEDEGVDMGFWPITAKQEYEYRLPPLSSWRLRVDGLRDDAARVVKRPRMRKSRVSKGCAK